MKDTSKNYGYNAPFTPHRFTRAEEIVNDDGRAIDEIAKLSLPQHELVAGLHAVTELKAHHAILGEMAVAHRVLGLMFVKMPQWDVLKGVGTLVMENMVTLTMHVFDQAEMSNFLKKKMKYCTHRSDRCDNSNTYLKGPRSTSCPLMRTWMP